MLLCLRRGCLVVQCKLDCEHNICCTPPDKGNIPILFRSPFGLKCLAVSMAGSINNLKLLCHEMQVCIFLLHFVTFTPFPCQKEFPAKNPHRKVSSGFVDSRLQQAYTPASRPANISAQRAPASRRLNVPRCRPAVCLCRILFALQYSLWAQQLFRSSGRWIPRLAITCTAKRDKHKAGLASLIHIWHFSIPITIHFFVGDKLPMSDNAKTFRYHGLSGRWLIRTGCEIIRCFSEVGHVSEFTFCPLVGDMTFRCDMWCQLDLVKAFLRCDRFWWPIFGGC